MDNIYLILVILLAVLALVDLVVGVSNDAVNFLNSAIASRAIPLKKILIIASFGLAIGAVFSSGLMEIARTGIFDPAYFSFHEISILFLAVMVADILLLNFFNSLGIPTSTTVSIIFCLLGASVAMGSIQLWSNGMDADLITRFINTSKATEIILGLLLSILLAFTLGCLVQFFARLAFTFEYQKNIKYFGPVFAGVGITCILGFIIIKGFTGISLINNSIADWTLQRLPILFLSSFVLCALLAHLAIRYFKFAILKFIVLLGLFGLSLSFAGNDLVNFIGVPVAAFQSYEIWSSVYASTGIAPTELKMGALANTNGTPYIFLIGSAVVMVLTLWFSKRVLFVTETEIHLASQHSGSERFKSHALSRMIVRGAINTGAFLERLLPAPWLKNIDHRFKNQNLKINKASQPSFDLIRASVNLTVASVLISLATSLKLPLSTTYVTFMVAMGAALADRAWSRESAVYRVAGVLNVVGSWILTALAAFIIAALLTVAFFYGEWFTGLPVMLFLLYMLTRSYLARKEKINLEKIKIRTDTDDIATIHQITLKHSGHISETLLRINDFYSNMTRSLAIQDYKGLKKNKKKLKQLNRDIENLKDDIIYQIQSHERPSGTVSTFYFLTVENLEDMTGCINQIVRSSYEYVNNNHKNLTFNQIRGLKFIAQRNEQLFLHINNAFSNKDFQFDQLEADAEKLYEEINQLIEKHIQKIGKQNSSPKNIKLYIKLLKKSAELISSLRILLKRYNEFYAEASSKEYIS